MLSKFSIKKPVTILVIILFIAIFGVVSISNMSVELIPDIDIPYFVVTVVAPGQSPEAVESNVTSVLEETLTSVNNVKGMQSISADNYSVIIMEMNSDSDLNAANLEISTKLKQIQSSLPENSFEPILTQIDSQMLPIFTAALSVKKQNISDSSKYINELVEKFRGINGVSGINTTGLVDNIIFVDLKENLIKENLKIKLNDFLNIIDNLPKSGILTEEEYQELISYDPSVKTVIDAIFEKTDGGYKMNSVGSSAKNYVSDVITGILLSSEYIEQLIKDRGDINAETIKQLVTAQNINLPAGSVTSNGLDLLVNVKDEISSLQELYNLPVLSLDISTMKDSVTKYMNSKEPGDIFDINGNTKRITASEYQAAIDNEEYTTEEKLFISLMYVKEGTEYYKINNGIYALFTGNGLGGFDVSTLDFSFTFKLSDITEISRLDNSGRVNAVINGSDGVILNFYKQPQTSTVNATKEIKKQLSAIASENENFDYIILSDQGETIGNMIFTLILNIVIGAILAVVVLYVFLRRLRPTLIVGASIFISIFISVILLYLLGVSLNMISLGGLVLSVGMLVDNSIVVYENICRKRLEGVPAKEAAVEGAGQVGMAIFASTITSVIVFLPIVFLSGYTRQLLMDLALSVTISLIASLLVSLSLIPMAVAKVKNIMPKREIKWFAKIQKGYTKSLKFLFNKKWIIAVPVLILFVGTIIGTVFVNKEFFPDSSTNYLSVTSTIDKSKVQGDYYLTIKNYISEIDELLNGMDFIEDKGISVSTVSTVNLSSKINDLSKIGTTNVYMQIVLKGKTKSKNNKNAKIITEAIAEVEEKYNGMFNVQEAVSETNISFGLTSSEVNVKITGADSAKLREISDNLTNKLTTIKGVKNVSNPLSFTSKSYNISIDSLKAAKFSLTAGEIYLEISKAISASGVNANISLKEDISNDEKTNFDITFTGYDCTLTKWYFAKSSDGSDVKIYSENFYNLYGEEISVYYLMDGDNKIILQRDKNKFFAGDKEYTLYNEIMYYEYTTPVTDLLTYEISASDRLSGESIKVPLYKLLNDESFKKDENGNIIMREGTTIPAEINVIEVDNGIIHDNMITSNTLVITLDKKQNMMFAVSDIKKTIKSVSAEYADASIEYLGENEIIQSVNKSLYFVFALAIVLVYLIMAATFQSFKSPIIVMITLLLAFTGAMLGLFITANNFSIFALLGIIVLFGVVVNNGIVFLDYILQMRKEGMDKREAIIKAAHDRLRPILMTSITTIIALLTSAFDYSAAGDNLRPLAITAIFGLLYATALTLFVVPLIYDSIADFKFKRKNKKSVEKIKEDTANGNEEKRLNTNAENANDLIVKNESIKSLKTAVLKEE